MAVSVWASLNINIGLGGKSPRASWAAMNLVMDDLHKAQARMPSPRHLTNHAWNAHNRLRILNHPPQTMTLSTVLPTSLSSDLIDMEFGNGNGIPRWGSEAVAAVVPDMQLSLSGFEDSVDDSLLQQAEPVESYHGNYVGDEDARAVVEESVGGAPARRGCGRCKSFLCSYWCKACTVIIGGAALIYAVIYGISHSMKP